MRFMFRSIFWDEKESQNDNSITDHIRRHIKCEEEGYENNKEYEPDCWKKLLPCNDEEINGYNTHAILKDKKSTNLYRCYKCKTEDIINKHPDVLNEQGTWFEEELRTGKKRYNLLFDKCSTQDEEYGLKLGYGGNIGTGFYYISTAYFVDNVQKHNKTGDNISKKILKRTPLKLENAARILYGLRETDRETGSIKYSLCYKPDTYKFDTNDIYILSAWEYAKVYDNSVYAFIEYLTYLCAQESDDNSIDRIICNNISRRCKTKVFGSKKPQEIELSQDNATNLSSLSKAIMDSSSESGTIANNISNHCFSEDQYSDLITAALVMTAQGNKQGLEWLKSGNNIHFSEAEDEFSTNSLFHFFEILYTLI